MMNAPSSLQISREAPVTRKKHSLPFTRVVPMAAALAIVAQFSVADQLSATVLTFDDVSALSEAIIPNGYGGLNWSNMRVLNTATYHNQNSGYVNGTVSGNYVAFNAFSNPAVVSGTTFDFNGAYLTAAWNNQLNVSITGLLGGSALYSEIVVVDTTGPTWFQFDFMGIDTLQFNSFGGTNAGLGGTGTHFAMDNFTFNELPGVTPVPEPSTYGAIAALALLGLIASRRYRGRRS